MTTYRVRTEVFEGPLDLLLHLVGRQKVDIREISFTEIGDEFIAHIERMRDLDLDVASEFLLLASTLLEIKAAALFPEDTDLELDDWDDLTPEEARALLVERLLVYKQFKNVAAEFTARMESEGRMHPRAAGLEEPFLRLMPDYLEGVTLRGLAVICADLEYGREIFLLEAEHVAAMPISLELHMESVRQGLKGKGRLRFGDLVPAGAPAELVVVTLLAILELYKLGALDVRQDALFGEIDLIETGVKSDV